jgi:hypothetical protein
MQNVAGVRIRLITFKSPQILLYETNINVLDASKIQHVVEIHCAILCPEFTKGGMKDFALIIRPYTMRRLQKPIALGALRKLFIISTWIVFSIELSLEKAKSLLALGVIVQLNIARNVMKE